MPNTHVDVLVVGGGLSGLVAAKSVRARGRSVAVLEANDRVGGRTWTISDAKGGPIDYGGMFIGETHSYLRELGSDLGIERTIAGNEGIDLILVDGKRILAPGGQISENEPYGLKIEESLNVLESAAERVGWEKPWDSPLAEELDSMTASTWIERNFVDPTIQLFHKHTVSVVLGASPSEVSMLYWAYYVNECEGIANLLATRGGAQYEWWVGGAGQVSERLAEDLGESVMLNTPVRSIDYSSEQVVVRTSSGVVLSADKLIVAMSPANAQRIFFSPALPNARAQLQMRSPMGRMTKVQLRFEDAPWRQAGFSGALTDCDDLGLFLFPGTKPTDTLETLIGFIGGDYNDHFAALSEREKKVQVLKTLGKAFAVDLSEPVYFSATDWSQQVWAQGGPVTIMPPGVLSKVGPALRDPIGPIIFAGTEASLMWSGYMEGAVRAGLTAAEKVMEA